METCLFIHGFTGGIFEIAPLSDFLRAQNYSTRTFLLKGLGGTRAEMSQSNRYDWVEKAEVELRKLIRRQEKVHLIGFSTGAIIASYLSVKYKVHIKTLTLLSTPVFLFNSKEIIKTLFSASKLKNYVKKMISTPYQATREFKEMVRESLGIYSKVQIPTLIIQGKADHLVQTKSAYYLYENIGSKKKKLLTVEQSGHLICLCKSQQTVFKEVSNFIKESNARHLSSCS